MMNVYSNHTVPRQLGLCKQKHCNYNKVSFPIAMNIAKMDVVYSSKGAINSPEFQKQLWLCKEKHHSVITLQKNKESDGS
jgi:hypothetical protein